MGIRASEPGIEAEVALGEREIRSLVLAIRRLSAARDAESVQAIVAAVARELTGADGAAFVLRDGDQCHYVNEDAVGPLWKGRRFPMSACISGWAMLNGRTAVIEDIYSDPRIPADAYRPTFVRSLAMVPIRPPASVGAIGVYWAGRHAASPAEVRLLELLADTTAVALENARLSGDYNRTLIEVSPDPLVTIGADGRIMDVNRATEAATGLGRDALVGTDFSSYFTSPELARAGYLRAFKEGVVHDYPLELRNADGSTMHVLYNASVYRNANGDVAGVFAAARDITEQERSRREALESDRSLKEAQRMAHIGSWSLDLAANRLVWSDEIYRIFEIDPETFGASYEAFLDGIHPEDRDPVDRAYRQSLEDGRPYAVDHRLLMKDGRVKYVHERCETLFDGNGKPLVSRGTVQDVTERRLAELRNERLQAELLQSQRMEAIGRLASGVAHDFNNLIMGITGSVALIREGGLKGADLREAISDIESSANSAAELTRQLLGFARSAHYETEPLDVNELVREGTKLYARTHRQVKLRLLLASSPLFVDGDRTRIEQVLLNLYLNAGEAMPEGGSLTVATREAELQEAEARVRSCTPGSYVRVSVTDEGVGMDAETRERAFEPFFTRRRTGRGSGLGLASAYGIIRNHGGDISIESAPGKGSTFHVLLPAGTARRERRRVKSEPLRKGRGTVLVIEDEPILQKMYGKFLKLMGYGHVIAGSGERGVEIFKGQKARFDLVILDLIMPGLSGRETFEALRALDPAVKVLLASGHSADTEAKRLMARGCNGFLQKPFTPQVLSAKVASIVGESGSRSPRRARRKG